MVVSAAELLLWNRCRRQWEHHCLQEGRRIPALPREMTGEANLRETARVTRLGIQLLYPHAQDASQGILGEAVGPPCSALPAMVLDPDRLAAWYAATMDLLDRATDVHSAVLISHGLAVLVDLMTWHPRLNGWRVELFRPGTGLRGVYTMEAAMVAEVCHGLEIPIAELVIRYLDKSFRLPEDGNYQGLFQESNLRQRAEKKRRTVADDRDALIAVLSGEESIAGDYRCAQRCSLCVPRPKRDDNELFSVFTLHKGGQLARELAGEGVTDLRDVDTSARRISGKQRIQIEAVLSGEVYVHAPRLQQFLARLTPPVLFLDFEAYAPALPPFAGLAPYEHVPVIASLHRLEHLSDPVATVEHQEFSALPGVDDRIRFFRWLRERCMDIGSIVVFSKGFESAMVRQLAARAQEPEEGERIVTRMVDLLEPFSEFTVYHPNQRGKVSLKRVLPSLTEAHYEDSPLQDGMHANLAYTRLADAAAKVEPARGAAAAAEAVSGAMGRFAPAGAGDPASVEEILAYCSVDTIAMVHLIRRLQVLASERAAT